MEDKLIFLEKLYKKLKESYVRTKPKNTKSVFLGMIDFNSKTKRRRLLSDASVNIVTYQVEPDLIDKLIKSKYISYIDQKKDIITLTSRGIWEAECYLKLIDQNILLNFIEKKWFDCFSDVEPLSEKEKVILFALLSVRAFSEDSAVDLRDIQRTGEGWREAVTLSYDFLFENKIIEDVGLRENLFKGSKTKASLEPIKHCCFRYSENLPKKTNEIFIAKQPLRYFLNLNNEPQDMKDNLVFLFNIIFEDKLDYVLMEKIYDFCLKTSYDISVKVFVYDKHIFAKPDYDELIQGALRKLLIGTP